MARLRRSAAPRALEQVDFEPVVFLPFPLTGDEGGRQPPPPAPAPTGLLNAYMATQDRIALVFSDPDRGRTIRRVDADYCFFVKRDELKPELVRKLKAHRDCRAVQLEQDWYRVSWVGPVAARTYALQFHTQGIQTYEGGIHPVLRHMVEQEYPRAKARRLWVDLETDSRVPFSRKEEGRTLSWATEDAHGNRESFVLSNDTDQAERELYGALFEVMDRYDMILAWNGAGFDFPVIKARAREQGILTSDAMWNKWLFTDHLEVFARMNAGAAESGDEKQSNRLEDVAQAILGEGKHDFDASNTWAEWAAGGSRRQRLLDYNIQDTALMPRIERKTGFIDVLELLSDTCCTLANSRGVQPSTFVDGYMQLTSKREGLKLKTVYKRRTTDDQFKGAYVMDPLLKGIVEDVHVGDFASLYPSIIYTWNISPETIRPEVVVESPDQIPAGVGEHLSWSPLTQKAFATSHKGLLPIVVKELMDQRSVWKKRKAAEPPGTDAWKEADRRSSAYKIAANSCYGVMGQPTNRLFDRDVAEAVTQCGAWLIHKTMDAARERGLTPVYGDTDSIFIQGGSRDEFKEFTQWCNRELYPKLLAEVGAPENLIDLDYEKQFRRIVFMDVKKRYAGSFAHYKGADATADSKPEIKGLEYKRGDNTRLCRRLQETVVYMLVGYKQTPVDHPGPFENLLEEWMQRFLNEPVELADIVISKKLSREIDEYKRRKKKDGSWAARGPHVEVAELLRQRGENVSAGTRISYVITDGTKSPAEVIPASDWTGDINRAAMWDSQIARATVRVLKCAFPGHDWSRWANSRKLSTVAARSRVATVASMG